MSDSRRIRLAVEPLEGRCVPTVITVTGIGDSTARDGVVTLREAILAADSHQAVGDVPAPAAGPVTINFAIPGNGLHIISPKTALPVIGSSITINGSSQPGYAGNPIIEINGSGAGSVADGFTLLGSNNTIRGLVIDGFAGRGIVIATGSNNNGLQGDWVGVNADGYQAAGNGQDGIVVAGSNNLVGGITAADRMVISGNRLAGIDISGTNTTGNLVLGSYIGTDSTGFSSIPNGTGIFIQGAAHGNQVGGWVPSARNVICGNTTDQIRISGSGTSGNWVQGNYIGVDSSGESSAQGGGNGVLITNGASGNLIGGTVLGEGNLIGGIGLWTYNNSPAGAGIALSGGSTSGNVIEGNWIGMDARGLAPLYDVGGGIRILGAGTNIIGGKGTAANVISDTANSAGVSNSDNMLPANWYYNSVRFLGHPELLGGSFREY